MNAKQVNVNIDLTSIAKIVFFLALFWVLYQLRDLVLVVLTAVVLASAIEPATKWFVRYKIPRVVGVLIMYALVFGIFLGTFYFFLPPLINDLQGITDKLPQYLNSENLFESTPLSNVIIKDTLPSSLSLSETLDSLSETVNSLQSNIFEIFSIVFGGVLSFLLIIVIICVQDYTQIFLELQCQSLSIVI